MTNDEIIFWLNNWLQTNLNESDVAKRAAFQQTITDNKAVFEGIAKGHEIAVKEVQKVEAQRSLDKVTEELIELKGDK